LLIGKVLIFAAERQNVNALNIARRSRPALGASNHERKNCVLLVSTARAFQFIVESKIADLRLDWCKTSGATSLTLHRRVFCSLREASAVLTAERERERERSWAARRHKSVHVLCSLNPVRSLARRVCLRASDLHSNSLRNEARRSKLPAHAV
jgi:hypothetical protein